MPTGSGTTRVVPLAAGVDDALKGGRTSSCIEQESSDVLQSRLEDAMEIRVECSVVCIMERFKGFSAGRKSALRPLAESFEGRKASPKNKKNQCLQLLHFPSTASIMVILSSLPAGLAAYMTLASQGLIATRINATRAYAANTYPTLALPPRQTTNHPYNAKSGCPIRFVQYHLPTAPTS